MRWENWFDGGAAAKPQQQHKSPVPVKSFERPLQSDRLLELDHFPDGDDLESLGLAAPPSSPDMSASVVKSFHKPFYTNQPTFIARRSPSTVSASSTAQSSPTVPQAVHSGSRSFLSYKTEVMSSSKSVSSGSSDDWHRHHQQELDMCVVPPEEWIARAFPDDDLSPATTDHCPDRATLAAVQNIQLYDAEGRSRPFGALYEPSLATHPRQLLIFIRHFYCGACQAYLKSLTENITLQDYFAIPVPTAIFVIGCGRPSLIAQYQKITGCPFPIFADPTRQLFKKLGMTTTVNLGSERPQYFNGPNAVSMVVSSTLDVAKRYTHDQGLRDWDFVKGGNLFQVGGEFPLEEGQVVWCHRMKNWRGHAEATVIRKLLELDL